MEFIMEFVLEMIFGSVLESKEIKVWTKTTVMALLLLAVEALFLFCLYCLIQAGDRPFVTIAMLAISIWFAWFGIRGTIDGHKRGWKQGRGY